MRPTTGMGDRLGGAWAWRSTVDPVFTVSPNTEKAAHALRTACLEVGAPGCGGPTPPLGEGEGLFSPTLCSARGLSPPRPGVRDEVPSCAGL